MARTLVPVPIDRKRPTAYLGARVANKHTGETGTIATVATDGADLCRVRWDGCYGSAPAPLSMLHALIPPEDTRHGSGRDALAV